MTHSKNEIAWKLQKWRFYSGFFSSFSAPQKHPQTLTLWGCKKKHWLMNSRKRPSVTRALFLRSAGSSPVLGGCWREGVFCPCLSEIFRVKNTFAAVIAWDLKENASARFKGARSKSDGSRKNIYSLYYIWIDICGIFPAPLTPRIPMRGGPQGWHRHRRATCYERDQIHAGLTVIPQHKARTNSSFCTWHRRG